MISLKELRVKLSSKDGYAPKSGDEKRFRDKHTVKVTADRNGNGDEVFKASKVKAFDRKPQHGYNVDKDQEVYEDVEQATDSIRSPASIKNLARQTIIKMSPKPKGESITKITPAQGDKVMEEVEELDEISDELANKTMKKRTQAVIDVPTGQSADKQIKKAAKNIGLLGARKWRHIQAQKEEVEIDEASRTPAYIGSVHTDDPDYSSKLNDLKKKASGGVAVRGRGIKDEFKNIYKSRGYRDIKVKHAKKVDVYHKEETELDEVLKPSMGAAAYIKDFVHSDDPKFKGKTKKQRMKQALAAYYSAKRGD